MNKEIYLEYGIYAIFSQEDEVLIIRKKPKRIELMFLRSEVLNNLFRYWKAHKKNTRLNMSLLNTGYSKPPVLHVKKPKPTPTLRKLK